MVDRGFLSGPIEKRPNSTARISAISVRSFSGGAKGNQALVDRLGESPPAKRQAPPKSLSHGCWRTSPDRANPGTTKLHGLEENIQSAAVELSAEDLAESALATIKVEGDRYLPHLQARINR